MNFNQVFIKRAVFVYGIKLFCFTLREMFHFRRNNAQAVFFKAAVNLADDVFFLLHRV